MRSGRHVLPNAATKLYAPFISPVFLWCSTAFQRAAHPFESNNLSWLWERFPTHSLAARTRQFHEQEVFESTSELRRLQGKLERSEAEVGPLVPPSPLAPSLPPLLRHLLTHSHLSPLSPPSLPPSLSPSLPPSLTHFRSLARSQAHASAMSCCPG